MSLNPELAIRRQLIEKVEHLEKQLAEEQQKDKDYTTYKKAIDEAVRFLTPCIFSARGRLKDQLKDVQRILQPKATK
jgi:hypothetical protein